MEITTTTNYSKDEDMQGNCPKCQSENVEYGISLLEGESLGYSCTCSDCGTKFIEWYNLEYSESVIKN